MRFRIVVLCGLLVLAIAVHARVAECGENAHDERNGAPNGSTGFLFGNLERYGRPRWAHPDSVRHASRLARAWPTIGGAEFSQRESRRVTGSATPLENVSLDGTDGNVVGLARSGNTLYIAGSFRSVGENRGGFVAFDMRSGGELPTFPKVAGNVYAIVPDGTGGWYIGGDFTGVGGHQRSGLAQIRADGSVSDWSPNVTGSPGYVALPTVVAIAVRGQRVYVAGSFRFIGDQRRVDLGCVDARTGEVLNWIADAPEDGYVQALALHGDTLFVGGGFSSLGGVSRGSLAAVSATTGTILPWQVDAVGAVGALLARGDTLFVGGTFVGIGAGGPPKLAAIGIGVASVLPIHFRVNGVYHRYYPNIQVAGLAMSGDTLYAVGNFTTIGGQPRSSIAAVNAATGDALPWRPDSIGPRTEETPPPLCVSVAVNSQAVYVGGYFGAAAGVYHPFVGGWDRLSGEVMNWTPRPDDAVETMALKGDTLIAGGYFHMMGEWQHRAGLAALDLGTGRLKPWNPNPNGSICTAITVHGDQVLVSGDFWMIGGDPQPRDCLAALDTLGGLAEDWNPGANGAATAFMPCGDTLFVGGVFSEVSGQTRNGLAAIHATTGVVLPWDPNAASDFDGLSPVATMVRRADTIYLGGTFTEMGGQTRRGLAAVDASTGELASWNPGTDNSAVSALLLSGRSLFVGGAFAVVGGQPRSALAELDLATGQATSWAPALTEWDVVSPRVRALALVDSILYVGGSFASVGGQERICLSGVDTTTGVATEWSPGTDGLVWSLLSFGEGLYAGGGFSRAGGMPASGLAAFIRAPVPSLRANSLELSPCIPNPVRTDAQLRFTLASAASATLSIYDLQGRCVAHPLTGQSLSAGQHAVRVATRGWPPGVYLCQLEASGQTVARKMVILN